jgi:hypothetical protein
MDGLDELARQLPIGAIAQRLGVSEAEARDAVNEALPALVSGLAANSATPQGEKSLEKALQKHSASSLLDGGVNVDTVDTHDGEKIVSNIFGGNKDQVVSALASTKTSTTQSVIQKILPIVAPIVLAWLAQKFFGKTGGNATGSAGTSGGGISDVLGGLLGGGPGGTASGSSGGLGDLLGGLLGGGTGGSSRTSGSSGGIGDLLGGLLGGGKK